MSEPAPKFDSRKYRVALWGTLLLTVMQLADKLSDTYMQGVLGLAFAYMLGNVGATWVAGRAGNPGSTP